MGRIRWNDQIGLRSENVLILFFGQTLSTPHAQSHDKNHRGAVTHAVFASTLATEGQSRRLLTEGDGS